MIKEIKKILSYFFVGGISAIIEWISFYLSNIFLDYIVASVIAFILATIFNYFLGKILTFKNYKQSKKDIISVFIVSGIGLIFNITFMYLFVDIIKMPYEIIAKVLSTGLVFIWNYVSRRLFIYREEVIKA